MVLSMFVLGLAIGVVLAVGMLLYFQVTRLLLVHFLWNNYICNIQQAENLGTSVKQVHTSHSVGRTLTGYDVSNFVFIITE